MTPLVGVELHPLGSDGSGYTACELQGALFTM
jgi:hypothetical protein